MIICFINIRKNQSFIHKALSYDINFENEENNISNNISSDSTEDILNLNLIDDVEKKYDIRQTTQMVNSDIKTANNGVTISFNTNINNIISNGRTSLK